MTKIIPYLAFFIVSMAFSQNNKVLEVKQAIDIFFDGFHKGDTALMKTVIYDKFKTQSVFKTKNGTDEINTSNISELLKTIAQRPTNQIWEERLLDYKVQIDGNLAHVWAPYEFWFNDKFSHCGVNSFQLFYDNGTWKIIYLVDSRRKTNCR